METATKRITRGPLDWQVFLLIPMAIVDFLITETIQLDFVGALPRNGFNNRGLPEP
jgi:hypothetical protein